MDRSSTQHDRQHPVLVSSEATSKPDGSIGCIVAMVLLASTTVASGCSLDFDQFETSGSNGDGSGDVVAPDGTVDGDTKTSDGDVGTSDADGPSFELGVSCESDADCGGAGCYEGYCTRECDSDADCPDSGTCARFGDADRCVVPCTEAERCSVAGRSDLKCARAARTPQVGGPSGERLRYSAACVPDADGDRVADVLDNCPESANADQRNLDGDAKGDACDENPRCHSGATEGTIEFGTTRYEPDDFGAPQMFTGNWLPVVGGTTTGNTGDSSRSEQFVRLDFESGSWKTDGNLPYPAAGQAVAPLERAERFVATPGNAGAPDAQLGRMQLLRPDGGVEFDGGFDLETDRPVAGTTGHGDLFILDSVRTGSDDVRRELRRRRPGRTGFKTVDQQTVSDRRTWWVTRNFRGRLFFYSEPTPDPQTGQNRGTILEVSTTGRFEGGGTYLYPDVASQNGDTRPFRPLLVPGSGTDRLYGFDRGTGAAAVVDLSDNSVTRAADLDLQFPFEVDHAAVQPRAPAFVILGRPSDGAAQLDARAYFPFCNSAFASYDSGDSDSVPDIRDNCPEQSNDMQVDTDDDDIGDACDPDIDNDGIANEDEDPPNPDSQRDTDNDGTVNGADGDIDGDGIANENDFYPYDTDNDGLNNRLDSDDDGDGYSDGNETTEGSDPIDPTDFPNIGSVTFVSTPPDAEKRRVKVGPTGDLGGASEIVSSTNAPHLPRFFESDQGVAALAGPPGETTKIVRWSQASGGTSVTDLGATIRGVAPLSTDNAGLLTSVAVIKPSGTNMSRWEIASRTFGDQSFDTEVGPFAEIEAFAARGSTFALLGGSASCDGCLSAFRADSGELPTYVGSPPGTLQHVAFEGTEYAVVAETSADGEPRRRAYVGGRDNLSEVEVGNFVEYDSVVPLDFDGHLVASARRKGNSFNLWLYNGQTRELHPILKSSDDLIELDWMR